MSIEVSCECAMTYRLPDRFAGKRCRCRECGDSIRVPALREKRVVESDSSDDEEPAEPVKKKVPLKARIKSMPSESLHQMAPLNLSESRCIDPPAARARIKKAKAAAATVNAKKRTVGGPASESELDVAEPRSKKAEKKNKKKKGSSAERKGLIEKKKKGRARDDEDEDEESDERPKKKKGKKAEKAEKKLGKGKKKPAADDEDEAAEGDEGDDKPKLSPRQAKRRQQLIMLGGSFGALIAVGVLFLLINAISAGKHEAVEKKFKEAKAKVAAARETARNATNAADAEKAYADAIAFVQDKSSPMPEEEEQGEFAKEFKYFQAVYDQGLFKKVQAARDKGAQDELNGLAMVDVDHEVIREMALNALLAMNDPNLGQIFVKFVSSSTPSVKALARKGLLQCGGKDCIAMLPGIINEGPSNPFFNQACERAIEGSNQDIASILAVADKDTNPQHLVAALNLMSRIGDPKFKPAAEKLSNHSDAEVQKAAQKLLGELKGFEKG